MTVPPAQRVKLTLSVKAEHVSTLMTVWYLLTNDFAGSWDCVYVHALPETMQLLIDRIEELSDDAGFANLPFVEWSPDSAAYIERLVAADPLKHPRID